MPYGNTAHTKGQMTQQCHSPDRQWLVNQVNGQSHQAQLIKR